MTRKTIASLLLVALTTGIWAVGAVAGDDPVADQIRRQIERIQADGDTRVYTTRLASRTVLPAIYRKRGYRPAWGNPAAVDQLLSSVDAAEEDGLNPADYHQKELHELLERQARGGAWPPEAAAALDLLLTDSLVRLAYHLMFGKQDPVTYNPHWNLTEKVNDVEPDELLRSIIESCSVRPLVDDCMPRRPAYSRMKSALADYRAIQAAGGWGAVPPGPTIGMGDRGPRVADLRRRLAVSGDLVGPDSGSNRFDAPLEQAVIAFQTRHRITADGRVGKDTLLELNVPVKRRIDTLRVALERLRWVLRGLPKTYVVADIARFDVAYYRNDEKIWSTRAQVGRPYRQTPVFKSQMTYLVFNPTWTVPPSILVKDILPAVRKNPDYLAERNIRPIGAGGKEIDPSNIDWSRVRAKSFPYQLRQDPGPENALGRIKFMFPNPYFIYMHDTPSKSLFERSQRAFSSGCIRIEKPLELAQLLLDDPVEWSMERIGAAVDSMQTRNVMLPRPVPVLLLYSTAWVDEDGRLFFTRDIYNRDPAVLAGLDRGFAAEDGTDGRPAI